MKAESERTLEVAQRAFKHFQHGSATGELQQFIDMLTEDLSFWFSMGQYHGLNTGKERAIAFFEYVSQTLDRGLTLTLDRVTRNETIVVFEFRHEEPMQRSPHNKLCFPFSTPDSRSPTPVQTLHATSLHRLPTTAMGNQTKGIRGKQLSSQH